MSSTNGKKTYHKHATGAAFATAEAHSPSTCTAPFTLYGSCFCPFVQRVWVALELKRLPYTYVEIDPYAKPPKLLAANPRGLVPAVRDEKDGWTCHESSVLMEYLEDIDATSRPLLPQDARRRAHSRLWTDHINRNIIPQFYRILAAQSADKQAEEAALLTKHLQTLVDAAHSPGPFFLGAEPSFVDVALVPWALRLRRVLGVYRGWPEPAAGSRWGKWLSAIEECAEVRATTSEDQLYVDSYERYAENRPGTSQVANAVNAGRGLP